MPGDLGAATQTAAKNNIDIELSTNMFWLLRKLVRLPGIMRGKRKKPTFGQRLSSQRRTYLQILLGWTTHATSTQPNHLLFCSSVGAWLSSLPQLCMQGFSHHPKAATREHPKQLPRATTVGPCPFTKLFAAAAGTTSMHGIPDCRTPRTAQLLQARSTANRSWEHLQPLRRGVPLSRHTKAAVALLPTKAWDLHPLHPCGPALPLWTPLDNSEETKLLLWRPRFSGSVKKRSCAC